MIDQGERGSRRAAGTLWMGLIGLMLALGASACRHGGNADSGKHGGSCSCGGRKSGDDGCGHSCSACPAGFRLDDSPTQSGSPGPGPSPSTGTGTTACVCAPLCSGVECGEDGCGGVCGTCAAGQSCDSQGHCRVCAPECKDKQCGPDGCGGACGLCAKGTMCDLSDGTCCDPSCHGRVCGPTLCGGSCGECPAGKQCDLESGSCK